MTSSDADLLNAFARHRDEKAFRLLAERHLALIFHTALRRTGNHALSQEIAQNVLCAVAQKAASLARREQSGLQPWLHRATLFEASKAMRAEDSRQRVRQLQHPDDFPSTATPADSPDPALWQQALPHLDQVMDRLPERDRQVLLLHFFENLSFPKIAARVGRSPEAVKKQSTRALEKLARLLRGRGVALPVGMIVTGLATESAKSAPVALLHSALPAALGSAAAVVPQSSLALMISSHQKGIAAGALLLIALPACWQQMAIARAERDLSSLATSPPVAPALTGSAAPGRKFPQITASLQIDQLIREYRLARRSAPLDLALREKLATTGFDQLGTLLDTLRGESLPQEDRSGLAELIARAMAKTDLPATMARLKDGWLSAATRSTAPPFGS